MAFTRFAARDRAFRNVFRFSWAHWKKQPVRLAGILSAVLLATLADVLTPLYAGRLVDAIVSGAASDAIAWNAALSAFMC